MLLRYVSRLIVLVMISSGRLSFRCASAFAASHIQVTSASCRTCTRTLPPWGGSIVGTLGSMRGGAAAAAAPSFSARYATSIGSSSEQSTVLEIAQESLGMMGPSVEQAKFGSIDYLNTSNMKEFRVLFILGGPGAGKGTQSAFLEENYFCVHLSVGDLLRAEQAKEDSKHRVLIEECLTEGKIVPVEISLALLQQAMQDAASAKGQDDIIFLVDGFPRNFDNLEGWVRCMHTNDSVSSVWGVLVYVCPLKELERRILERAQTSGRSDDNLKSAQKRFTTFEQQTMPVVDTLKLVQKLQGKANSPATQVIEITGDQTVEEVWRDTQTAVNSLLANDVLTANAKLLNAAKQDDVDTYVELCSEDLLDSTDQMEKTMELYEGDAGQEVEISNCNLEFVTGTKAIVSYDRTLGSEAIRETRVWSHHSSRGWVTVHFSRTPLS